MNTITCESCGAKVVRGHAHIRTRSFVQVGYCRPCWTARRTVTVPAPRVTPDVPARQMSA